MTPEEIKQKKTEYRKIATKCCECCAPIILETDIKEVKDIMCGDCYMKETKKGAKNGK